MNPIHVMTASLITAVAATVLAPVAHAEDNVTYEIVSDVIPVVNIEYFDHSTRKALQAVPLPWRTDVTVVKAVLPTRDGAELRADWRPYAGEFKWVTLRISVHGKVLCESTLDIGDATCYGNTPFTAGAPPNFPLWN
jgi:hypothetical protein